MIYFNDKKEAFGFEIENPIAIIEDSLWTEFCDDPSSFDIVDGEFKSLKDTEEYKAKKALEEQTRIANLKLTKREVFLGLYKAKGITPDMLKAQITSPEALIEFEYANDYYRGNPLISAIGATLGISEKQLDEFFETNDYAKLTEE